MLFSLATVVLALFIAPKTGAGPEPIGWCGALSGTVSVVRSEEKAVLNPEDPVFVGDRIVTGPEGSAEIVLADESRMELAAETNLAISEFAYDPEKRTRHAVISLLDGRARFAMRELPESSADHFRVLTATAAVGSSDTDFIVSYEREHPRDEVCMGGLTTALCLKDSVVVMSVDYPEKPAVIAGYMLSRVCGGNMPTPPRFATPAELAAATAGIGRSGGVKPVPPLPAALFP